MKQTITYTNSLSNFDNNKIPLEQQICLMKARPWYLKAIKTQMGLLWGIGLVVEEKI